MLSAVHNTGRLDIVESEMNTTLILCRAEIVVILTEETLDVVFSFHRFVSVTGRASRWQKYPAAVDPKVWRPVPPA